MKISVNSELLGVVFEGLLPFADLWGAPVAIQSESPDEAQAIVASKEGHIVSATFKVLETADPVGEMYFPADDVFLMQGPLKRFTLPSELDTRMNYYWMNGYGAPDLRFRYESEVWGRFDRIGDNPLPLKTEVPEGLPGAWSAILGECDGETVTIAKRYDKNLRIEWRYM